MSLDTLGPKQLNLTRPNSPSDPNGIAHATDSSDTGNGVATKASRATAKLAWAQYVQDYLVANYVTQDSSGPAVFPDNGEIDYSGE